MPYVAWAPRWSGSLLPVRVRYQRYYVGIGSGCGGPSHKA